MRSYPNKSYLCVIFTSFCTSPVPLFVRFIPRSFFRRKWCPEHPIRKIFLPKWKIRLQTEVMTSWVQLSGGFCSFPWFSTNRGLFRSSIYKGNMKENQGNEQNPPDNCTQEIITSVWSRIFHFGKKNLSNWYPNIAFPQRNRPGSSSPKNPQGHSANLYAHVPLIGARPHIYTCRGRTAGGDVTGEVYMIRSA